MMVKKVKIAERNARVFMICFLKIFELLLLTQGKVLRLYNTLYAKNGLYLNTPMLKTVIGILQNELA